MPQQEDISSPNVLFIAVDDMNDWVGCLGGHPQSITPNIDELSERVILFTNAHCTASSCIPSHTAVMSGLRGDKTGIYQNFAGANFRQGDVLPDVVTLTQDFQKHGYVTLGSGKLFHGNDEQSWDEYWPYIKKNRPNDPVHPNVPLNGLHTYIDWGPVDATTQDMGDSKVTDWVISQLSKKHDKPFFLGCGIYKPHEPWYIPQKYLDKFPEEDIILPEVKEDDRDDLPEHLGKAGKKLFHQIRAANQYKKGVQAYLACMNFADECVGRLLDALEKSEYADNTIIVLWSDHGFHLGEKYQWSKFTLWEESTRIALMIYAPGITKAGTKSDQPANLIDIYPTLIDLCKLEKKEGLDGISLMPQIKNPNRKRI